MTRTPLFVSALFATLMLGACGGSASGSNAATGSTGSTTAETPSTTTDTTTNTPTVTPAASVIDKYVGTYNFCKDGEQQRLVLRATSSTTLSSSNGFMAQTRADCKGAEQADYDPESAYDKTTLTYLRTEQQATLERWPQLGQSTVMPLDIFRGDYIGVPGSKSYEVGVMLVNGTDLYFPRQENGNYVVRSHYVKE